VAEGEAAAAAAAGGEADTCARRNPRSGKKGEKKPKSGGFGARCAAAPRAHGVADTALLPAESMGLLPLIFNALRRKGYRLPTPVQRKAIPLIMAGACSSGRTFLHPA